MSARAIVESSLPESRAVTPAGTPVGGFDSGHYRIEGFKYWIDVDGVQHRCSDHSDWATEELGLDDDDEGDGEGDGEKAGDNITAARDEGYADVHTERDSGTGEEFVYVRVPWSELTKAQREAVKAIAERIAGRVVDDSGARPVEVYDASGLRRD